MKSLKGLALVKSLVSVLSVISAYKGRKGTDVRSNQPSNVPIASYFMVELGSLLKRIGTCPVPGLHQVDSWNPSGGGKHAMWWTAIQPSSEHDWALVAQPSRSPLSLNAATNAVRQTASKDTTTGLGLNRTWSLYDTTKLTLGHQILESTASILRSLTSNSTSHQSLSGDFDITAVAEVFNCCAELSLTKSYAGENAGPMNVSNMNQPRRQNTENKSGVGNSDNWLTSTKPVLFHRNSAAATGFGLSSVASLAARAAGLKSVHSSHMDSADMAIEADSDPTSPEPAHTESETAPVDTGAASVDRSLSFVAENLICALYSVSQTHSSKDLAVVSTELQASVRFCGQFPAHSFISEVGRWLGKAI